MALDKVIDSAVLDADLLAVADAIREKGGTSEQLVFPEGFVSAVEAISASGGYHEKFYETDFVVEETFTANGVICTVSTGLSDTCVTVGNELVLAVFTCEPLTTPTENWVPRLLQFISPNQGTIQCPVFGFYVQRLVSGDELRKSFSQGTGAYLTAAAIDLSSLTVSGRFNMIGPVPGNYHLELYRLGVVV